jgi:quinol monooxygenase YgiN
VTEAIAYNTSFPAQRPRSQIKPLCPPQYIEVPPNIEVKRIISYLSAVLSHSPNPLLLKDVSKLLIFQPVGRPFAITICMILVIIRMKVLSEKHLELSQTIALLIVSIRREKGCQRCDFCQSTEDEDVLFLLEEWDTQENLKSHLKSGRFRVLRGAMNLLKEPYEMVFHTAFHPVGMEKT